MAYSVKTSIHSKANMLEGLTARGGRGVLPYKGMFFGIFVLNRVSNLSCFVLIRVSVYQFLS